VAGGVVCCFVVCTFNHATIAAANNTFGSPSGARLLFVDDALDDCTVNDGDGNDKVTADVVDGVSRDVDVTVIDVVDGVDDGGVAAVVVVVGTGRDDGDGDDPGIITLAPFTINPPIFVVDDGGRDITVGDAGVTPTDVDVDVDDDDGVDGVGTGWESDSCIKAATSSMVP
jgi:hypothetical protein